MIDLSLISTITLIFVVTLIGAWLRSRRIDPCLDSFQDFHVTLELQDERLVWGVMDVASTGIELRYRDAVQDEQHIESSYVLYATEYESIQAIYRYADELAPESQAKREKAIRQAFHPSPFRYLQRQIRNFLSTAAESFNEVLGLLIGRAKKPAGRYITDTGETYLRRLSSNVIGHVGGPYDPLLERFIGRKVVIELAEGGEVHEHVGILKDYSPDFLEVLDVQFPYRMSLDVAANEEKEDRFWLRGRIHEDAVEITNRSEQPILIVGLDVGEGIEPLNIVLDAGITIPIFPQASITSAKVHYRIIRELDIVVPRTRCQVRHRAEGMSDDLLTDIIFDVGVLLHPGDREKLMEARLRKRLRLNPKDAIAAGNLGGLLLQRQQYLEAERWLKLALDLRHSLPDHGKRALMQMRELERRWPNRQSLASVAAAKERKTSAGDTAVEFANADAPAEPPSPT